MISFRTLGGRFFILLAALGVMALGPWIAARQAEEHVHGVAHQLDLAGSLRYRLLAMSSLASGSSAARSREVPSLVSEQRAALEKLVQGDPKAGVPPCPTPDVCQRLRQHLRRWNEELAPRILATARGETSPELGVSSRIVSEFDELDRTVHAAAGSAEQRIRDIRSMGLVASMASLVLVVLVGGGVWDVFGRIRRVRRAAAEGDTAALELEARGLDEIASLAKALAQAQHAERQHRKADQTHMKALRAQHAATGEYAEALNAWIAGVRELRPALSLASKATRYGRAELVPPSKPVDPAADRELDLTWGKSSFGTLALYDSQGDHSPENDALAETFAQILTLAQLAHSLLHARAAQTRLATILASIPALESGSSPLGGHLREIISHDVAMLDLLDDKERVDITWQLEGDQIRWLPTSHPLAVPSAPCITDPKHLSCPEIEAHEPTEVLEIPLEAGGERVGALRLLKRSGSFSPADLETANNLAPLLASALSRMLLQIRLRLTEQWSTVGAFGRLLAHEIKNPINSLQLQLHMLERDLSKLSVGTESEKLEGRLSAIRAELTRLDHLVQDRLGMHEGGAGLQVEVLDLRDLVRSVLDEHVDVMRDRNIQLEVALGDQPARVNGNPVHLRHLIHNLVDNALEAMQAPGAHRLSAAISEVDDEWALSISDTGCGVPDPHAIFAPGFTTKASGTGMGLALSLQIARQHRGKLIARPLKGGGSELRLRLARSTPN